MPKSGGQTTQSGIYYQNSIAALYLGRLCDAASRPDSERVARVRVESPNHVDDIVVTFADGHKTYIQAKENVSSGDIAWRKVWRDFDQQYQDEKFQRGKDRLLFQIGNSATEHHELHGLCERALGSENYAEWQGALTISQGSLLQKIRPNLSPELSGDASLLEFIKHIEVEIRSLQHLERDSVAHWMPPSNKRPIELFRLLRDRVGGYARIGCTFTAHDLRESLRAESPELQFATPPDIQNLFESMRQCGALLRQHKHTIANTGQHFKQDVVNEIVTWLAEEGGDEKNVALLLDQAGMGKTVVLRDVLLELDDKGIPTLAMKADQQLSEVESLSEVQTRLNLPFRVEDIADRFARSNRTVVIIDQIDALSLSLAHNQKALDVVLDLVARLRLIPNVRVLLSCRIFDRHSDYRLFRIDVGREFTLQKLSEGNIKSVLTHLEIEYDALTEATKNLLQTPLYLDLFALALEQKTISTDTIRGLSSLQDLYALIWDYIVLKVETNSPATSERIEVIRLLTAHMDRHQRVSAPHSVFQTQDKHYLEKAINWLAGTGILVRGKTEWTFLHQTFFDYCFARRFVEEGGDIVDAILHSNQGLFERSKLHQVIAYLRGNQPQRYLNDFQKLLNAPNLRFHLYDLLLRWFGSLTRPTDDEWVLAQRMLLDPGKRPQLLAVMYGNPGWFQRLRQRQLESWLLLNNEMVDNEVIPYLASLVSVTQADVINIVKPFLGRDEKWNNRISWLVSRIRDWHTIEAIELFEQIVYRLSPLSRHDLYEVGLVATTHPKVGCRLISFVLNQAFNQGLQKKNEAVLEQEGNPSFSSLGVYFNLNLTSLENGHFDEALKSVSRAEPKLFVEVIIPWLEKVVSAGTTRQQDNDYYQSDELSHGWYDDISRVRNALVHSLIGALIELARSESDYFRQIAARLAMLPSVTPQLILTHVYRAIPDKYANDAFEFLSTEKRRLDLGDSAQYDSRQLITAITPFLDVEQRVKLEKHILSYAPIYKYYGVDGLRRRGIEQLYLLQAIPFEYLTDIGVRQLRELEHKFPNRRAPDDPTTIKSGFVGSPISEDIARKMSDRNWLRAMEKYKGSTRHSDFLKGGGYELSGVLARLTKENPTRYYRLIQLAPDNVDDAYVEGFISGLAESDAPVEWLFNTIRQFTARNGPNIKRGIARNLQRHTSGGIPDDIVKLLESYLDHSVGEDELWWSKGDSHGDAYSSYLNSVRGGAFETLMRIWSNRGEDEALEHRWQLIEFATLDKSTALRIGAIHELTFLIRYDREKAISLFEKSIKGHEILLTTPYVREFLYWAFYKNFLRLLPYMLAMMNSDLEKVQEQGAQLVCIAALSKEALESPNAYELAQELAKKAMTGTISWRRGAARIYARNITRDSKEECAEKMMMLLNDEDKEIRQQINGIFYSLQGEHIFLLREFIEAYAKSSYALEYQFAKFLWEHGLLDPAWSLSIIRSILENLSENNQNPWISGVEELTRLVLRIYTHPTSDSNLRKEAMNTFDVLIKQHSGYAQKALSEWDRR